MRAVVFACGMLSAACWRASSPAQPTSRTDPQPPSRFSITLERTPCFGRCPTFLVRLDSDGRVLWRGIENVAVVGERTRTVAPRRTTAILDTLARIRFFERDTLGDLPAQMICTTRGNTKSCDFFASTVICGDTSHAILTVMREGKRHRIDHARCTESPLDDLAAQVEDIAGIADWIGERD
jgi:hypothetical protein